MIDIATPAATTTEWQPVVIGATGGSGTRAFHGIMGELGLFMGERVNGAGDAMDFEPFLDRWINPIISSQGRLDYDWSQTGWWMRLSANTGFKRAMKRFQTERPGGSPWGWKNPRSMYVLPMIAALVPGIRFIHVVRDGRDMAFSDNQNQRRKHFAALFGEGTQHTFDPDTPAASAALWATANMQVADWGERHLGPSRYRRIRLEELCADPTSTVAGLGDWLFPDAAPSGDQTASAAATVKAPSTLGRWKGEPQTSQDAVTGAAQTALQRFGYITG